MDRTQPSRRQVLTASLRAAALGVGAVGAISAVTACSRSTAGSPGGPAGQDAQALASAVAAAEGARPSNGAVRELALTARPVQLDLAGRVVATWAYGDGVPGKPLRATAGDRVRMAFRNDLPEPTSVHWHGLAIRNDMDGVPDLTTPAVAAGASFTYDFVVPHAGTHWFHPHHGMQLDHGLYAPFVVDDPAEPGGYDAEWVLVLDDWTDGVGPTPEELYRSLQDGSADLGGTGSGWTGGGTGGMGGMGSGGMGGMDMSQGDLAYPLYLVNGHAPQDPDVLTAKPGQRVRLRIVNAAADTVFTVALQGHRLTVTHSDGYPVRPVTTTALRIGMGERYDAVVTLGDGVFQLAAAPAGKAGLARAVIRTAAGTAPAATDRPTEVDVTALTAAALTVADGAALPATRPDTVHDLVLAGTMSPYRWTINGRTYDEARPLDAVQGQTVRLRFRNASMMPHPMHLHGHTFQVGGAGTSGPRKDTVLLPAMAAVAVDLVADNPGRWMLHCHNAYHAEAGMMTRLDYRT